VFFNVDASITDCEILIDPVRCSTNIGNTVDVWPVTDQLLIEAHRHSMRLMFLFATVKKIFLFFPYVRGYRGGSPTAVQA